MLPGRTICFPVRPGAYPLLFTDMSGRKKFAVSALRSEPELSRFLLQMFCHISQILT